MSDRVQRFLDGELTRGDLSVEEQKEAAAYGRLIREVSEGYRSIEAPDLAARVMMRLPVDSVVGIGSSGGDRLRAAAGGGAFGRALSWIWTPRPIRLRPVWGLAAAAFLVLAVLPAGGERAPAISSPAADGEFAAGSVDPHDGDASVTRVFVQFRLDAPGASAVRLAGSFTGWEAEHALYEMAPGVWSVLIPLEAGVHDYAFIVDEDEWVADPLAPAVSDGFGGVNSRLSVLLPNGYTRS